MSSELAGLERRYRRLKRLKDYEEAARASVALHEVWEGGGRRQETIRLRVELISATGEAGDPPPVTRLLQPRGIALRFYLIAVFEAQCRLASGESWTGERPLRGPQGPNGFGWTNFVAVDGAYSSKTGEYLGDTKNNRHQETCRLRQLQGALRTLEDIDAAGHRALVQVPRKGGRIRDYGGFQLMNERGCGSLHEPQLYTVPTRRDEVIGVPVDFFLHGWVHVLTAAEMITWLALRRLSQSYPHSHAQKGVYLYAKRREGEFALLRDSYEDSCNTLLSLGLIRYAVPPTPPSGFSQPSGGGGFVGPEGLSATTREIDFSRVEAASTSAYRRGPDYYQVIDKGLEEDALEKMMKELVHRIHQVRTRQKNREQQLHGPKGPQEGV
ncbi:hypothetical protein [Streptomyces sp. NPDC018584]|uniref:hypothetical protein n=1 Tax=unclassified Streptomyces TaxID=2593676 RepID=UPI003788C1B4